ncbi:hypothetical protein B0H34DRAFT_733509 [Crassisporium funariophilum]|nr:hypothetical protein B0H34DRAFT_733509 [Crassisporium funariophilum]
MGLPPVSIGFSDEGAWSPLEFTIRENPRISRLAIRGACLDWLAMHCPPTPAQWKP